MTHLMLRPGRGIYFAARKGLLNEVGRTEVRAPNTAAPVQERGIYSAASPHVIRVVSWLNGCSQGIALTRVCSRLNKGLLTSRLRAFAVQPPARLAPETRIPVAGELKDRKAEAPCSLCCVAAIQRLSRSQPRSLPIETARLIT
jgi:hypothetical protein